MSVASYLSDGDERGSWGQLPDLVHPPKSLKAGAKCLYQGGFGDRFVTETITNISTTTVIIAVKNSNSNVRKTRDSFSYWRSVAQISRWYQIRIIWNNNDDDHDDNDKPRHTTRYSTQTSKNPQVRD